MFYLGGTIPSKISFNPNSRGSSTSTSYTPTPVLPTRQIPHQPKPLPWSATQGTYSSFLNQLPAVQPVQQDDDDDEDDDEEEEPQYWYSLDQRVFRLITVMSKEKDFPLTLHIKIEKDILLADVYDQLKRNETKGIHFFVDKTYTVKENYKTGIEHKILVYFNAWAMIDAGSDDEFRKKYKRYILNTNKYTDNLIFSLFKHFNERAENKFVLANIENIYQ